MDVRTLRELLDRPVERADWFRAAGLPDAERASRPLLALAEGGVPLDLLATVADQLARALPDCDDPQAALERVARFTLAARSPLALAALFERDPTALPEFLFVCSASPYLADVLASDPESYDLLRLTEGMPVAREALVADLKSEVEALHDERDVAASLRRFARRETLRIAYGDLLRSQPAATVARQNAYVADAVLEGALSAARRRLVATRGEPRLADGRAAGFVVLAMGSLGGNELDYSGEIELVLLYEGEGETDGARRTSNAEFFERLTRNFLKLVTEATDLGPAYRVDLRRRPGGIQGPIVHSIDQAYRHYDLQGRTWERQAYVKARPAAGDVELGQVFLDRLAPWLYRRYLTRADISGIKALKRKIERRARLAGEESGDGNGAEGNFVAELRDREGGIRHVEFATQFLQLLNGGDLAEIRTGNVLEALDALERTRCLTDRERATLTGGYEFLRSVEHRAQLAFDRRGKETPEDDDDLARLAKLLEPIRKANQQLSGIETKTSGATGSASAIDGSFGQLSSDAVSRQVIEDSGAGKASGAPREIFPDSLSASSSVEALHADVARTAQANREVLDHLLHEAFADDQPVDPAVDLVFDPEPTERFVEETLRPYGFRDVPGAYANLLALASERNPFLSTRRCRHFLAAIVTRLLEALSQAPDPDVALANLARVSESLGGKGVLWELFSFNAATLGLYVRLCGSSDYLAGILTGAPGMIDELLDSLLLDRLPTREGLRRELEELSRNAEDIEPILHSFKNMHHLNVGVRDVLGKDDLQDTHRALADVAEVCLEQLIARERRRLEERFGVPSIADESGAARRCELFVLGLGKLGAREPNYHSDLDVVFLYEADGMTRHRNPDRETTNRHFFSELGQRLVKVCNERGPYGRLFDLDARHGAADREGPLAVSLDDFARYFAEEDPPLRERQALVQARIALGPAAERERVLAVVHEAIRQEPWRPEFAESIRAARYRLEENATARNLKRGSGGTVDVEYVVQMLQLKHAADSPDVLQPGTLDALAALRSAGALSESLAQSLAENYRFLRTVESHLRLMNASARHDLPQDEGELRRLAYLLLESDARRLAAKCDRARYQNRQLFDAIFAEECGERASA